MKKYELTEGTKQMFGRTLHRIRAVRNFGDVHAGDLGGWIEKEENLSHSGSAWVYDEAMVFDDAMVCYSAKVRGEARVFESAKIAGCAEVSGDAIIREQAQVYNWAKVTDAAYIIGRAHVRGEAQIDGNAVIGDDAAISGYAVVGGNAHVHSNAVIRGNALIKSATDYLRIGPIGSREGYTTFYRGWEGAIKVACGCFDGTIDEFAEQVARVHGDNRHGRAYRAAIEFARTVLSDEKED